MPNWYWEKKELLLTPSQEKGMPFDTETRYRREGVRFIMELGKALNLSHNTMATGAVYFHRFYMFHAFQDFPKFPVATCSLFLAGKAEETPKKCRDIIRTVRLLTNDKQFLTFGVDPREEIMALERVLLQTIHFDLQVDHPYASIIKYAKTLKGDKNKLQKMVQMSWTFVNDSLCTTLCLQWEPEIIAIAVMYLAAKLSKFEVKDWANRNPSHIRWWDQFVEDLRTSDLEEICHQVLDLYMQPTQNSKDALESPPPSASCRSDGIPPPVSSKAISSVNVLTPNSKIKAATVCPAGSSAANNGSNLSKTTPPLPKSHSSDAKSRPQTPPPPPMAAPLPGMTQNLPKPPLPATLPPAGPPPPALAAAAAPVAYQHFAAATSVPAHVYGSLPAVPAAQYTYPANYPVPPPPPLSHAQYQQSPYNYPPPPPSVASQAPYFPQGPPLPPHAAAGSFHRGPPPMPPHHSHARY